MFRAILLSVSLLASSSALASYIPYVEIYSAAGQSSGFYIGNDLFVTAGHAVEGKKFDIYLKDDILLETNSRPLDGTVVYHSKIQDLAILRSETPVEDVRELSLRCDKPQRLEEITRAYGYIGDLGLLSVPGSVMSMEVPGFKDIFESAFMVEMAISPGLSGSALLGEDGKVIGVVTGLYGSGRDKPTSMAFAVPISLICNALEDLKP